MKKKVKLVCIMVAALLLLFFAPIPDYVAFKIGFSDTYMGSSVGFGGYTPLQYYRYMILNNFTTTSKLKSLYLNHNSPAVKCYSFKALLNRTEIDHFKLLKEALFDERRVVTHSGCIILSSKVGDLLIKEAQNVLSASDNFKLDSLLLYSDTKLRSKHDLLLSMKPKPEYYSQILKLTSNSNHPEAIVALSKFQMLKDSTIIKSASRDFDKLYYFLLAVKHFPIESFKDDLLEIQQKSLTDSLELTYPATRALYKALIQYNSPDVRSHLQQVVDIYDIIKLGEHSLDSFKISKYKDFVRNAGIAYNNLKLNDFLRKYQWKITPHYENIYLALTDFQNPYYDDILSKISLDDHTKDEIMETIERTKAYE